MEHLDLEALSLLVAVEAHGGLNAAGREGGTPKATLSRRIRALEADLGISLLDRGGNHAVLTTAGKELTERVAPLLAGLREAATDISAHDGQVRGNLRVSIPALMARSDISAYAHRFLAQYPAVTLQIDVDDRLVDLREDGYDIVIRANPDPTSELVGKCFLRTHGVLAAAPGLVCPETHGVEVNAVVLTAQRKKKEWTAQKNGREIRVVPKPRLLCSSMMLIYDAVLAGVGVGILPAHYVQADIASGRLNAWGDVPDMEISAWVLHHPTHLTSPKIRAFVDGIFEAFQKGSD